MYCFITTGARGLIGKSGGTGATGQGNATRTTTTTQAPCFGPRGKIVCTKDDDEIISVDEVLETFRKLLRFAC